jgi:hypothetical protein
MKANKAALSLHAREFDCFPRHFQNFKDIDAEVDRLVRWIKEAVAQHIPLLKPAPFSVPWWSSELLQLVRLTRRARRERGRQPSTNPCMAYQEALCAQGWTMRKAKVVHFKQAVADTTRGRR